MSTGTPGGNFFASNGSDGSQNRLPMLAGDPRTDLLRSAFTQLSQKLSAVYDADRLGNLSISGYRVEKDIYPSVGEEVAQQLAAPAQVLRGFLRKHPVENIEGISHEIQVVEGGQEIFVASILPPRDSDDTEDMSLRITNLMLPERKDREPLYAECFIAFCDDGTTYYHLTLEPVEQNDEIRKNFDKDVPRNLSELCPDEVPLFAAMLNILQGALSLDIFCPLTKIRSRSKVYEQFKMVLMRKG